MAGDEAGLEGEMAAEAPIMMMTMNERLTRAAAAAPVVVVVMLMMMICMMVMIGIEGILACGRRRRRLWTIPAPQIHALQTLRGLLSTGASSSDEISMRCASPRRWIV